MGLFLALLFGFLHHIVPADTPGGIVSWISAPPAAAVAMAAPERSSQITT